MPMRLIFFSLMLLLSSSAYIFAQTYQDHFGTGNDIGVSISTSDTEPSYDATNTLNGTGYFPDQAGASRFLGQSTWGSDMENINYVTQIGIEAWLAEQFTLTGTSYSDMVDNIYSTALAEIEAVHGTDLDLYWGPSLMNISHWQKIVTEEDYLRQRVAFALSEILVTSAQVDQLESPWILAAYYDILYNDTFGNYRDLLYDVTMSPAMGLYLSHFNNPKTDEANNIRPDENYAREIMQLFTIGLYELNNDGTEQLDSNGNPIPTYDNDDIKELAKVFSGFSGSAWHPLVEAELDLYDTPTQFGWWPGAYDRTVPMTVYDSDHEPGAKYLLNGYVIPSGQTGLEDVDNAIDHLFNHPNVGPFIGTKLIKLLIKSNPTPNYVNRVAMAFNNNGQGVRGDMQAVIRAIYTDPEARDCEWIDDIKSGKLREPLIRYSHMIKAFNISSNSERYWFRDNWGFINEVKQSFMHSPSVFNYFVPSYAPNGVVNDNGMVAPEFQILDSNTAINYINQTQNVLQYNPMWVTATVDPENPNFYAFDMGPDDETSLDYSGEIEILNSDGLSALIDHLDLLLCHNQIIPANKTLITNAMQEVIDSGWWSDEEIVGWAIYLVMNLPDYVIMR